MIFFGCVKKILVCFNPFFNTLLLCLVPCVQVGMGPLYSAFRSGTCNNLISVPWNFHIVDGYCTSHMLLET